MPIKEKMHKNSETSQRQTNLSFLFDQSLSQVPEWKYNPSSDFHNVQNHNDWYAEIDGKSKYVAQNFFCSLTRERSCQCLLNIFNFGRKQCGVISARSCVHLKIPGLSIGMGFLWESHGKRSMGWDSTNSYFPWDSEIEWKCQNVTELSYLGYTSEF